MKQGLSYCPAQNETRTKLLSSTELRTKLLSSTDEPQLCYICNKTPNQPFFQRPSKRKLILKLTSSPRLTFPSSHQHDFSPFLFFYCVQDLFAEPIQVHCSISNSFSPCKLIARFHRLVLRGRKMTGQQHQLQRLRFSQGKPRPELSLGTKLPMCTESSLLSLHFCPTDKCKSTLLNVIIPSSYARSTGSFAFAFKTPRCCYYRDLGNDPRQRRVRTAVFCSVATWALLTFKRLYFQARVQWVIQQHCATYWGFPGAILTARLLNCKQRKNSKVNKNKNKDQENPFLTGFQFHHAVAFTKGSLLPWEHPTRFQETPAQNSRTFLLQ